MRKLLCIVSVLCALLMMCPTALAEGATSDASEPETSEVLTIGATEAQADGDASDVSEAVSDQPTAAMLDSAEMPASAFSSFTYDCWGNTVRCPDPYALMRKVGGTAWGLGDVKKVKDLYADSQGYVYLSINGDTEKDNAVLRLDRELNLKNAWYGYSDKGKFTRFSKPDGIFVTQEGELFVADTQTRDVYHLTVKADDTLELVATIAAPSMKDSAIIDQDFVERYIPAKIVVDHTGRTYVVATNVNEGIVTFNEDNKFDGFLAAGKVTVDPFTKFLKKYIYTKEQIDRIQTFVPISYNNIDLDEEGFIFTTLAASNVSTVLSEIRSKKGTEAGALVRRLNMMGTDILKRDGYEPPVGDTDIVDTVENKDATYQGISQITDVSCGVYGTYALLDNNRNHVFVYNNEGYLLYAFGGPDTTAGGMKTPIALAQNGDYMYVLDSDSRSIFLFKQTEFASSVMGAIELEKTGKYTAAADAWQNVLRVNANYDLAYLGLGKTAYWNRDYDKALELFQLCNNQSWYSKAWAETRKGVLAKWFMPIVLTLLGIVVLVLVLKLVKNVRAKKRKGAERA
ncbi:MAG: hypothetical protein IKI63_05555 [Clostridia bacterium]|nr:hypothetical protein [Clostridia bacterium]